MGLWSAALAETTPPFAPSTTLIAAHERQKPVRKPLPDDLPREVIEIDLSEEQKACPCCGEVHQVFGEEVSEKLDVEPARMSVLQYRRKKYACRRCAGEVQVVPLPAQVIEQGMATPGLHDYPYRNPQEHMGFQCRRVIKILPGLGVNQQFRREHLY